MGFLGENKPLTFRNVARPLSISSEIGYDLPAYTPNRIHLSTTGLSYIGQHIPFSFSSVTLHLSRFSSIASPQINSI